MTQFVYDDVLNKRITDMFSKLQEMTVTSLFFELNKEKTNEAIIKMLGDRNGFGTNHRTVQALIYGKVKTIIILDVGVISECTPHITQMHTISVYDLKYTFGETYDIFEKIISKGDYIKEQVLGYDDWFSRDQTTKNIETTIDEIEQLMK